MSNPDEDEDKAPPKRAWMPWDVEDLNLALRAIADEEAGLVFYVDPRPRGDWMLSGGKLPAPVIVAEAKEGADTAQSLAQGAPGVCHLRDKDGRIIKSRRW